VFAYDVSGFYAGRNDARKWTEFCAVNLKLGGCGRVRIDGAKSGRDGSKS
jgi:hypothetical protein